jgi:hypothetical protein
MNLEELAAKVDALCAGNLKLTARCDALDIAICTLAHHCGVDPVKMDEAIDEATNRRHQELLENIEAVSPALAAKLDRRPLPGL